MMLTGPDGNSFQLSLEGYQYPNRASRGEQDEAANRLLVSVEASIHDQAWQKTSPCLLTWEIDQLIEWVEKLPRTDVAHNRLLFSHPGLTFQYAGRVGEHVTLEVYFDYAMVAPGTYFSNWEEPLLWATLRVTTEEAALWLAQLRSERAKFPPR